MREFWPWWDPLCGLHIKGLSIAAATAATRQQNGQGQFWQTISPGGWHTRRMQLSRRPRKWSTRTRIHAKENNLRTWSTRAGERGILLISIPAPLARIIYRFSITSLRALAKFCFMLSASAPPSNYQISYSWKRAALGDLRLGSLFLLWLYGFLILWARLIKPGALILVYMIV